MKLFTKIKFIFPIIVGLFIVPLLAIGQSIPNFPMAFWGDVNINGNPAPVDTVIRAYYGDSLAGEVAVIDAGAYGYIESTGQKLLVGEGVGQITFKFQNQSLNGGVETMGDNSQTHPEFISGEVTKKDLEFSFPTPTPVPTSPPTSGGGGGGGGGSTPPSGNGADANNDGKVDILDFNYLMINWGQTGQGNIADFNGDGKVDILDFNLLMINWTK